MEGDGIARVREVPQSGRGPAPRVIRRAGGDRSPQSGRMRPRAPDVTARVARGCSSSDEGPGEFDLCSNPGQRRHRAQAAHHHSARGANMGEQGGRMRTPLSGGTPIGANRRSGREGEGVARVWEGGMVRDGGGGSRRGCGMEGADI